jgi:hypothetical protein
VPHFSTSFLGKDFVLIKERPDMWLKETTDYLIGNANEVCFTLALMISFLFFKQYKKYEDELEKADMLDRFLSN